MAGKFLYYLILKPISFLPLNVLHILSYALAFVLQNIVKYRRKLIVANIAGSFPKKSEQEIKEIVKGFYLHFSDLIFESIKYFNLTNAQHNALFTLENTQLLEKLFAQGRSAIACGSHIGNWEGATCVDEFMTAKLVGIYKPLKNKFIDKKLKARRTKHGALFIPFKETYKLFEEIEKDIYAIIFITDQSPSNTEKAFVTNFLNRKTAFHKGAAKYAKRHNIPLFHIKFKRTKRGHYLLTPVMLAENPKEFSEDELNLKIVNAFEAEIKENPKEYLWSHNRWKKDLSKHKVVV